MKEAFETMGNYPILTLFLGIVFVLSLAIICDTVSDIFNRTSNKKEK
jgi:hypothetical protein